MIKKVYFDARYCEEARLATQRLIDIVEFSSEQKEFISTNKIDEADLLIYYACGHLQHTETASIKDIKAIIGSLKA